MAIDWLGRSADAVTRTIAELSEHRILLLILREGVYTGTPMGRSVATIVELGSKCLAAYWESILLGASISTIKPLKLSSECKVQLRRPAATGELVRELTAAFGIGRVTA
ncbi:hypothetical protein MUBE_01380 [Mycobacterium uberis]|uniref:Uncharacterized protein n=1 Tax=Mycobacterium uberis TaxID=2162698 RepID=A0A3E1HM11_9MYCO|nr:hypothetical protein MUBE_01380 [Mycobacterium uberis]